jgi:hypothetical protein
LEEKFENVDIKIYVLFCSTDERKKRMIERGNKRDEEKLKDWDNYLKNCGDDIIPKFEHIFISNFEN